MTTGEKVYNSIVLSLSALCITSIASIWFVIIPRVETPGPFYFVITVWVVFLIVFSVTSLFNFARHNLVLVPTVLQIIFQFWTVVFIPLAIWGIVLLKRNRQRKCQQSPAGDVLKAAPEE